MDALEPETPEQLQYLQGHTNARAKGLSALARFDAPGSRIACSVSPAY